MNTRRAAHGIAGRILTPALFLLLTGSAERALCQYIPY